MALSSDLVARPLLAGQAAAAFALSREAGWNQTEADWKLMIGLGNAVGVWTPEERLVATALTLPYSGAFAWISMVIVTGDYRQQGIATHLLNSCAQSLQAEGIVPGLDATEAGREVYLPLGFQEIYPLSRMWARTPPSPVEPPPLAGDLNIRGAGEDDFPALCAYDNAAFGAERPEILRHLLERQPARAFLAERDGKLAGFSLARDGREALQIGPLVADSGEIALGLAYRALLETDHPVYMDVADRHAGLLSWLTRCGFSRQRPYTRMILGRREPFDDPQRVFAIAGPELG